MVKEEEPKCFEVKNCSDEKRRNCPAWHHEKNCWEVMDKEPKVQCAERLKDCVQEKCPFFMEYTSEITAAWIKQYKASRCSLL